MSFIKEFKEFAMRGNVIDLAIGVIIGGAFSKIVSSFIDNVLTPLLLKPALDFANLNKIEDLTMFGTVKYGSFLAAVINFIIVALVLFIVIKGINSTKKKNADTASTSPPQTKEELLLTEIRDLLKKQ